ncbi:MAG: thioredoxin domain-containing protein, partial [Acidimicrobiales bacterium]|nr:thioredoxin domain-containing protein [Acidimicrobiales bacterium]
GGMPSFTDLLHRIDEVWRTRRDDVDAQADEITRALRDSASLRAGAALPGAEVLDAAVDAMRRSFDPEWGGFGRAPKFPSTMNLDLLLRAHAHASAPELVGIVTTTLDAMASGGIYDHLGGGFARYSVDAQWLVPHFEKMLYDQALLARIYLHAWQVTGERRFLQVLEETIEYVLRDLRHPGGGFYSAEDADSEGVEGRFYVWTPEQVRAVLGPDAAVALEWYGVTEAGNFEGATILHRPVRGDLARPHDVERARRELFDARARRVRPGLDDKVLTEWNGLMLATLAEAAAATGRTGWLADAVATAEFLVGNLRRPDGRWLRSWQADEGGRARHLAYAADHGALLDAFVRLAEATGDPRWLDEARAVADSLLELFWDDVDGGVFTTGTDAEQLVTRPKDLMDNATPSANSLVALGLLRLAALTGQDRYRERAEEILRLLAPLAARHPQAFGHLLAAADLANSGTIEVVVAGDRPDLVRVVTGAYRPNTVLAWGTPFESPLWAGRDAGPAGRAYVCRDFTCHLPVETADALAAELGA